MTAPEVHRIELRHAGPLAEISTDFIQGMLDRMAVSYHKYGAIRANLKSKVNPYGPIDAIACARQRIEEYERTGNTEFLMDAANFCMMRFTLPLDGDTFQPTDSDGSPGLTTTTGTKVREVPAQARPRVRMSRSGD